MQKNKSLLIILICYITALICSVLFINLYNNKNLILTLLYADIVATIIIYISSFTFKNSSIIDPYWSLIPPLLLLFWIININTINILNTSLLIFNILFWSIRLTYNWFRNWEGLEHEDWRYIDLKDRFGKYYQLINFLGIHLFTTLIIFSCCMPFKYIIENKETNINILIGFIICIMGVLYELIADQQLYNFKKNNPKGIIKTGLWKYSRHPNYYGEILFWWGLFIYSYDIIYLIVWPLCMTLMFLSISIPWIEKKILLTRPEYKDYQKKVNVLSTEITLIKNLFK